jgi:putative DNA primase/helicase
MVMTDAHKFLDSIMDEHSVIEDTMPEAHSDEALALRYSERHKEELRYVSTWGSWLIWDGQRWKPDDSRLAIDFARKIVREVSSDLVQHDKDSRHLARAVASKKTVSATETLARADRRHASTTDAWDRDPFLLNTPDGTVDLRSGDLRDHDTKDMITRMTAAGPAGDCPRWKDFLVQIFDGNPEVIAYVQRVLGYALTGLAKEHALFFLYGTGANGKSVLLNTVIGILGDYADIAPIDAFVAHRGDRHPTELADMRGKRLVVAQETEDGQRWAEAKIKSITGGDRIKARFMRQDFFTFLPQFTLIIAGNHKPSLRNVDEATQRRFNLIPFNTTIPKSQRDPNLETTLKGEWPGIMTWLIDGCLAYQREGLISPGVISDATGDYLREEDALGRFIDERCEIIALDPSALTQATELFDKWKSWCEATGDYAGTQKSFSRKFEARGYDRAKDPKTRRACFRGIKLLNG